jgi:hypothetical protein
MKERVTTARRRFRAACYAAQGTGQRRADIARTIAARTGVPVKALDTWPTVAFRPTAFSRRRGELLRLEFEAAVAAVDIEALLAELRAEGERLAAEMGVRV